MFWPARQNCIFSSGWWLQPELKICPARENEAVPNIFSSGWWLQPEQKIDFTSRSVFRTGTKYRSIYTHAFTPGPLHEPGQLIDAARLPEFAVHVPRHPRCARPTDRKSVV